MFAFKHPISLTALIIATLFLIGCGPAGMNMNNHMMDDQEHMGNMASHMMNDMAAEDTHGGHGGDVHETISQPPIEGAPEIRIVADEFGFTPDTLNLTSGEAVNIVLVNEGALPHDIDIEALGFHGHANAGETITVGLQPTQTGEFEFICTIAGHYEAGMFGQATISN